MEVDLFGVAAVISSLAGLVAAWKGQRREPPEAGSAPRASAEPPRITGSRSSRR